MDLVAGQPRAIAYSEEMRILLVHYASVYCSLCCCSMVHYHLVCNSKSNTSRVWQGNRSTNILLFFAFYTLVVRSVLHLQFYLYSKYKSPRTALISPESEF